jgi:hypothetical protein
VRPLLSQMAQEGRESRIRRKASVRFGGGLTETWLGDKLRRWEPTLRYDGGKSANRLAEIGSKSQGMASRANP